MISGLIIKVSVSEDVVSLFRAGPMDMIASPVVSSWPIYNVGRSSGVAFWDQAVPVRIRTASRDAARIFMVVSP
jgi:hypothetical protein